MRLSEIQADVYRKLAFGSSPASEVVTRVLANINETHRQIHADPVCSRLRRLTLPFTTIATERYAALPQAAERLYSVRDELNDRTLSKVDTAYLDALDPSRTMTGSAPDAYAIVNLSSPISRQPSDASQLVVDSTSASDTGVAHLRAIQESGIPRATQATMTGTTAVNIGPTDVIRVTDFFLAADAVGVVTLIEDSDAGNVLATIGIGKSRARYSLLEIYPKPSSAYTLYADVDVLVMNMTEPNDEPVLPEIFHPMLSLGARMKEWEKREKSVPKNLLDDWSVWKKALHMHIHQQVAMSITPDEMRGMRSQLGPYYPAGS